MRVLVGEREIVSAHLHNDFAYVHLGCIYIYQNAIVTNEKLFSLKWILRLEHLARSMGVMSDRFGEIWLNLTFVIMHVYRAQG